MSRREEKLLVATDTNRRLLQHGAVLVGIVLPASAGFLVNKPDSFTAAIAAIVLGLVLFIVAASIKQRWEVGYKGHRIRFENNPFLGERLFIDDEQVARGKLGYRSEMRGTIEARDGEGDHIVARSEAGLLSFRCHILVEPAAESAGLVSPDMTNEQLLEEVRPPRVTCGKFLNSPGHGIRQGSVAKRGGDAVGLQWHTHRRPATKLLMHVERGRE